MIKYRFRTTLESSIYLAGASDATDSSIGQDPWVPDCSIGTDLISPEASSGINDVLKNFKRLLLLLLLFFLRLNNTDLVIFIRFDIP